ncbi:MAG: diacylglycerol/lipid kinase family protein [Salinivenus sp.]
MYTCAIVNPAAGGGRVRRLWPALLPPLLAASERLTVRWTSGPGTATVLTRRALHQGADRVVAIGGDGTLHGVVNGFFEGTQPVAPSAVCAFVACGTGSDARWMLGLPTGADAIRRLHHAPIRPIDLLRLRYTAADGTTRTRYAINVASVGLSGAVVRWTQRTRRLPLPPRLRYLGAIVAALCTHRPHAVTVHLDGHPLPAERVWIVAVANGTTFGAGLHIAPTAQVDDGELNLTIVRARPVHTLLSHAAHFYRGTLDTVDGVTTHTGRVVTARPAEASPAPLEADGERLGHVPVSVEVVPGALRVQA